MMKFTLPLATLLALMPILPASPLELSDLFEKAMPSVVTIYTEENLNTGTGDARTFASNMSLGSGVLVSETKKFVLTAAHVVGNAERIMVDLYDGETIPASVDRISRMADVGLILNVPQESGWLVQHVVKGSPADISGVKGGYRNMEYEGEEILLGGDIILSVDGIKITGMESVEAIMDHLDQLKSSASHTIKVLSAGEQIDLYWISSEM
jgi:serine protease Do